MPDPSGRGPWFRSHGGEPSALGRRGDSPDRPARARSPASAIRRGRTDSTGSSRSISSRNRTKTCRAAASAWTCSSSRAQLPVLAQVLAYELFECRLVAPLNSFDQRFVVHKTIVDARPGSEQAAAGVQKKNESAAATTTITAPMASLPTVPKRRPMKAALPTRLLLGAAFADFAAVGAGEGSHRPAADRTDERPDDRDRNSDRHAGDASDEGSTSTRTIPGDSPPSGRLRGAGGEFDDLTHDREDDDRDDPVPADPAPRDREQARRTAPSGRR